MITPWIFPAGSLLGLPARHPCQNRSRGRSARCRTPSSASARLGLIGYDIPVGKRTRYFAFVWPEPEHAHMGWEHGIWMDDPDHILRGAHINLRKVRYVTYEPGEAIPEATLVKYTRQAARLATMSREERVARELDRD
jgi:hypothetical protein